MKSISLIICLILLSLTSACSHHKVYVTAAVDPAFAPSKSDPLYLMLSAEPTIIERQLLPILREELCRCGFNLVDSADRSKWTMGVSYDRRVFDQGSSTSGVFLPGRIPIFLGSSKPTLVTTAKAYLYLIQSQLTAASKPIPIWEGSVSAEDDVFKVYRGIIFKNVLDFYGLNFEGHARLSKAYLREPGTCPPAEK